MLICIIGTHWNTTGATITLGCHRKHNGWCEHLVVSQWQFIGNLHNWKTTGSTGYKLATKIFFPVASWCTLESKFQTHWITTELPLNYHWFRVRGWRIYPPESPSTILSGNLTKHDSYNSYVNLIAKYEIIFRNPHQFPWIPTVQYIGRQDSVTCHRSWGPMSNILDPMVDALSYFRCDQIWILT